MPLSSIATQNVVVGQLTRRTPRSTACGALVSTSKGPAHVLTPPVIAGFMACMVRAELNSVPDAGCTPMSKRVAAAANSTRKANGCPPDRGWAEPL
jgi:hypothetical protein